MAAWLSEKEKKLIYLRLEFEEKITIQVRGFKN